MKKSPLMAGKAGIAKKAARMQKALQSAQAVVPNLQSNVQQLRKENDNMCLVLNDYATRLLEKQEQQQVLLADLDAAEQRNELQARTNTVLRDKLRLSESDAQVAQCDASMYKASYNQVKGDLQDAYADIQELSNIAHNTRGHLIVAGAFATFAVIAAVLLFVQLIYVS